MKAIAIVPGTAGSHQVERPEPSITTADEIKIRIIRVGICGTDREEVAGGRAEAPEGQKETGHRARNVRPSERRGIFRHSREGW